MTNLPPYNLRIWDADSLEAPRCALDEEWNRVTHLPPYQEILHDRMRQAGPNRFADAGNIAFNARNELEAWADDVAERLGTSNRPDVRDKDRAMLISLVGIRRRIRSNEELVGEHTRRRYSLHILSMAAMNHITINEAEAVEEEVGSGLIPDVKNPYIIAALRKRFLRRDKTLWE